MTVARLTGIVLIVLGAIGLAFGGITYTKKRHEIDVGPLEVNVEEKERIPLPPVLGGIALVAGVVLVVLGGRRRSG